MIVIPMAGASRRFTEAGYTQPKYMLPAHGRSLFAHSVASFERYFDDREFLFICRDIQDTAAFVRSECQALGIRDAHVLVLDRPTGGQAETVALGVRGALVPAAEPLTIFNIDTFRPGFEFPEFTDGCDGFLEVFRGSGSNWSFVRSDGPDSNRVVETAEKRAISDLCCTGLYHFSRAADFLDAFDIEAQRPIEELDARELYVAPLYNKLIARGGDIRFSLIPREDVIFCGVPVEYTAFLSEPSL